MAHGQGNRTNDEHIPTRVHHEQHVEPDYQRLGTLRSKAPLETGLPNPALVLDRWWDVVDRNSATDILLDGCAAELLDPPVNAIRLTLHPDGLASRISNLGQWRAHLLTQLRSRFARTGDERLRRLLDEVVAYPGENAGTPARTDVVVRLQLQVGATELSILSIAASVESATDITIDELQIEAFYPADEVTLKALARSPSPAPV